MEGNGSLVGLQVHDVASVTSVRLEYCRIYHNVIYAMDVEEAEASQSTQVYLGLVIMTLSPYYVFHLPIEYLNHRFSFRLIAFLSSLAAEAESFIELLKFTCQLRR
jgi:hypothetical protein